MHRRTASVFTAHLDVPEWPVELRHKPFEGIPEVQYGVPAKETYVKGGSGIMQKVNTPAFIARGRKERPSGKVGLEYGLRKLGDPHDFRGRLLPAGCDDELLYMDIVASLYNRNNIGYHAAHHGTTCSFPSR